MSILSFFLQTNASYFEEYYSRRASYFNITEDTPSYDIPIELSSNSMYDAVWATALSLNATETTLQVNNQFINNNYY